MAKLEYNEGSLEHCVLPDGTRCKFADDGITRKPVFGEPAIICRLGEIKRQAENMNREVAKHLKPDGQIKGLNENGMHMLVSSQTLFLSTKMEREFRSPGREVSEMSSCIQGFTSESAQTLFDSTMSRMVELREKYIKT